MKESMLRRILALVIVALYIAGLVFMFCRQFRIGLSLWFISTAGGALLLYIKRSQEKREKDEAEFDALEEEYRRTRGEEKE